MSKFTKSCPYETEFEEDKITMNLNRLRRADMMVLMPFMNEAGKGEVKVDVDLMNLASDLLPNYVENFKGLKDEDGNPVTIETVCDQTYFMTLAGEIIAELFNISKLGDEDSKNSDKPRSTTDVAQERDETSSSTISHVKSGSK